MPKRFQQRGRNHRQHLFDPTTDSTGNSAGVVTGNLVYNDSVADAATVEIESLGTFDCAEWVLVITQGTSGVKSKITAYKHDSTVLHSRTGIFYIGTRPSHVVTSGLGGGGEITLSIENKSGSAFDVKLYRTLTI